MTTPSVPICEACSRLRALDPETGMGHACDAFPAGIPDAIYLDGYDHRDPYPGDGGIRFLLDPAELKILQVYEEVTKPPRATTAAAHLAARRDGAPPSPGPDDVASGDTGWPPPPDDDAGR
jgi:hypothetical protein